MSVPSYTVLFLLCLGGFSAQAATIYVRSTGNDATSCTQARNASTPRKTITAGIACLSGGDTLIVGGGTYDERLGDSIAAGSSWDSATTIKAAPGETVWMQPSSSSSNAVIELDLSSSHYIILDGINIDARKNGTIAIGVGDQAHHIRFQNMEIKDSPVTCIKGDGAFTEWINIEVHGCAWNPSNPEVGGHGMYMSSDHMLLDHVHLHHNINGYGVQFSCEGCGGRVHDNILRNSIIHDNGAGGVILYPNNMAYNNVIYHNRNAYQSSLCIKFGGQVYNTVCYDNDIGLWPWTGGAVSKNNIALGNMQGSFPSDGYDGDATSTQVFANNLCGSVTASKGGMGCTLLGSAAAIWQNAPAGNFHLTTDSPALQVGTPLDAFTTDMEGTLRPQGQAWDLGPYQASGGTPRPPVPAPTHLRATVQ
jgi:hypothetical protein